MLHLVENLEFKADISFVTKDSPCFRSLNYPPKDDFVMSVTQSGKTVSRYGDDTWDFTSFGLTEKFQFNEYDETNKAVFKQLMYYLIYSHLFPGKYSSLAGWYHSYQNIFRACTEARVMATELSRYPKVIESMAKAHAKRAPSNFSKSIWHFDVMLKNHEQIGFTILNQKGIAIFKLHEPEYEYGQTPYIPSRIWTMFIKYLDSVLDDFERYQGELENLYDYLSKSSFLNESNGIPTRYTSPFSKGRLKGKKYYFGTFEDYLDANNLTMLFEKYTDRHNKKMSKTYEIEQFGALLNNIVVVCFLHVLYYSIMRKNEALSLRVDCLVIEKEQQTGSFYLLKGETTKTDPDSDARWIVPKSVVRAVNIAKKLVSWKLKYIPKPNKAPYLFQIMNVWQVGHRKSTRREIKSFDNVLIKALHFYKPGQFKITQEDYNQALALTPSLMKNDWFKVGGVWNFSYHQFRRTLAVHFALNKVSASSIQLQMKHGTRKQQFHYQNNAGRLRLNKSAEQEVVNEYYAEMARNIASVVHGEQVLPHNRSPVKQEVVRFIEDGDIDKLLKAQKNGAVGYRKNLLGGCMKQGPCEYGGFDSIVQCAGGVTGNICSDLIIDGSRGQEFEDHKAYYEAQVSDVLEDSPKHRAVDAEIRAYENVLDTIKRKYK